MIKKLIKLRKIAALLCENDTFIAVGNELKSILDWEDSAKGEQLYDIIKKVMNE